MRPCIEHLCSRGDLPVTGRGVLTRSRPDRDVLIIPQRPSFYRDPQKDHWARMGIDATAPFERRAEFTRKRVPGVKNVDLADWFDGL